MIDPGVFSDLSVLDGAGAVLISHSHPDHAAVTAIAAASAPVWGPEDVITQLAEAGASVERLTVVAPGDSFVAAGFEVSVYGGDHAEIYPGLPHTANNAYLVGGSILHAGDSFAAVPSPGEVKVLLLPVAAPWLKRADAIDYARSFPHAQVLPVHDAVLTGPGKHLTDTVLSTVLGAKTYARSHDGRVQVPRD